MFSNNSEHVLSRSTPINLISRRGINAMAFIPVENTAEVCMEYKQDNQFICNVFHVLFGAPPTAAQLTTLATDLVAWWNANVKAHVAANMQLWEIRAKDLTTASGVGIAHPVFGTSGTSGSPAMPNNVTVAVKWLTGLSGRSYRGRSFITGLVEGSIVNNALEAAALTAFQNAFVALRTAINVAGRQMVVASKYSGVTAAGAPIPRAAGITTVITGSNIEGTVDSQRRRLPGRGR